MATSYELHSQGQDGCVYTCNNCKKHVETRCHCTVCDDFDLCVNCFDEGGHPHKMDKLAFGLDDDSGTCDQKQTNPEESRRLSIERCIQNLIHACQCCDANCRLPSCQQMKRVIQHAKNCKRETNGSCPICKQFIALSCYHAKRCQEGKCPVPFCLSIQRKIRQQQLQQRLQQARILMRQTATMKNRGMSVAVLQQSPGNSSSSNQPSPSPQPHTSPHTPQPGIGMKPSTDPPAGALQAVQQVQAAAARQRALHMVATANYGKGPPVGQPVPGNPEMISSQQQIQVQVQKLIPQMMSGVPSRMIQAMGGWEGPFYEQQGLQDQPHQPPQPQPTMGLHQVSQHIVPSSMPNAINNPVAPMGPPSGLPSTGPGPGIAISNQDLQQLLQALKSPASQQQQQQVLAILKSNPHLMAAFIKQRSAQQQQQPPQEQPQQQMLVNDGNIMHLNQDLV